MLPPTPDSDQLHEHRELAALAEAHRAGISPSLVSINHSATGCGQERPFAWADGLLNSGHQFGWARPIPLWRLA